ncbi:hypothetical protein JCM11491_006412 [Sporobolomyces phaffii]
MASSAAFDQGFPDFDTHFGPVLDNMIKIFVVKDEHHDADAGTHASPDDDQELENNVETVLQVERRAKEWRQQTKEVVDRAREQLRGIAMDYKSAVTASQRSATATSSTDHQRQMESMFQSTVNSMKLNSDLDQQVMELQGELQRLHQELKEEELDAVQVGGLNSDVLKLKLFRDLGFTPLADRDGKFTKMIVRSAHSAEARTVELDSEVNDFQWCNWLWGVVDGRIPPGTTSTE